MKHLTTPAYWLAFRGMLKQQLLLLMRYPVNLLANFFLVLVSVVMVTLGMLLFAPEELAERLKGITLYGFVIYTFLSHTIWSVGLSIQKEKTEGSLASLYLTPASRFLSLLARSLVALAWTGLASFGGLFIAQAIVGPLPVHHVWLALGILALTISGLIGLGFAIAGFALRFGESIELVANLLEFGLIGLCAFFFPFSLLPPALRDIARLVPLSYAVDAFRTVAIGQNQPELLSLELELIIVTVTGLLGPPLGYAIYRLQEYQVRQQGRL
jgi:ABC-2 type transport system permease protein